jgi:hypothetical protein
LLAIVSLKPLNRTPIKSVKPVPVITTEVPAGPLVGVKPLTVGGGITVKLLALVAVPPAVAMLNIPVTAPLGTIMRICESDSTA